MTLGNAKEKSGFSFALLSFFFVTLALPKLLALGKAQIYLAFLSFFRNFAI